jgi:hypothetical protein
MCTTNQTSKTEAADLLFVGDERAQHTIIAALRHWQCTGHSAELEFLATNGGEVKKLSDDEVDELLDRLNVEFDVKELQQKLSDLQVA